MPKYHPLIWISVALVVVIAGGSVFYYHSARLAPSYIYATVSVGRISEQVTVTGQVNPAENPDLSFERSGRLVSLPAEVGRKVSMGQLLAALDGSDLEAQRLGAEADLKTQEAKLDELKSGPRDVDVRVKQTQSQKSDQDLVNLYAGVPDALKTALSVSEDSVRAGTDNLFVRPTDPLPSLVFKVSDSQTVIDTQNDRVIANSELDAWSAELSSIQTDFSSLDASLASAKSHLVKIRNYLNRLSDSLNLAVPDASFPVSSVQSAQAGVINSRAAVNRVIASVDNLDQSIKSQKLVAATASDQLKQTEAGSQPQDIEMQTAQVERAMASLKAIEAQISKTVIRAPFAGTVSKVSVKRGQIVSPNSPVVSIIPDSPFEIDAVVAEGDVSKLKLGDSAKVTLDAYGTGRSFDAAVTVIDQSPTISNGVSSYGMKLVFAANDPAIKAGMTANVVVSTGEKDDAILVPRRAIVSKGDKKLVLFKDGQSVVEREIRTGLEGSDSVEVLSGLKSGDQVVNFGK